MAQIVVVGSYNRDVVFSVARLPSPGETCLSAERMETDGGKGSNQAIQAARCGAGVVMLAAIGRDAAGDAAMRLWSDEGVEAGGVARIEGVGTGLAMILVDRAAENVIVVDSGANARLSPDHVEGQADRIRAAEVVVAQLETPSNATRAAFAIARAAGRRTVLNAAPAGSVDSDLLALTDVLIVNEGEGAMLAGAAYAAHVGEALLARVGEAVIVTAGAAGATLFRRARAPFATRPPRIVPLDTTGAGDALIGAFCARLVAGGDMEDALAWGVAAGALACTRRGAAASYAARDEIAAAVAAAHGCA